jgi:hypothetical protein
MEMEIRLFLAAMLMYTGAFATTTITYQGQLTEDIEKFSGYVSMTFQLYETELGNDPIGLPVSENVEVVDGLFQVELEFGNQPFQDGLWLQVVVDGNELSPRQRVSGIPFAIRADTAEYLGDLGPDDVMPRGSNLACGNPTTEKVTAIDPTSGDVVCDTDQDTTYSAGTGLSISETTLSVSFAGSGTATSVARSDHDHSLPSLDCTTVIQTYVIEAGDSFGGGSAVCALGYQLTGGGCYSGVSTQNLNNYRNSEHNGQWVCRWNSVHGSDITTETRARCCRLE